MIINFIIGLVEIMKENDMTIKDIIIFMDRLKNGQNVDDFKFNYLEFVKDFSVLVKNYKSATGAVPDLNLCLKKLKDYYKYIYD